MGATQKWNMWEGGTAGRAVFVGRGLVALN